MAGDEADEADDLAAGAVDETPDEGEEDSEELATSAAELIRTRTTVDDVDDDVHFGVAAKALGVSRKTVERMVKRGQLDRGPSGQSATVSKRALVAMIESRRGSGGETVPAAVLESSGPPAVAPGGAPSPWPFPEQAQMESLLRPLIAAWVDELVESRTQAELLRSELDELKTRHDRNRSRDELLRALSTGNWVQRYRARRYALRHLIRDEHLDRPEGAGGSGALTRQ